MRYIGAGLRALLLLLLVVAFGCDLEKDFRGDEYLYTDEDGNTVIEDLETGDTQTVPNVTNPAVGSGEFLWKPVSESDGKLVILLPSRYRGGVVNAVDVLDAGGRVIERGRFVGDTHNGNRPHYRFNMQGSRYGTNLTVRATLTAGGADTWQIPNGAQRNSQ